MKKANILILLTALLTISCASVDRQYLNQDTLYYINDVNLNLYSKCAGNNYPNKQELAAIFTKKIKDYFCKEKNCTTGLSGSDNVISISVNINYTREFAGEAFKCNEAYGLSHINYSYSLSKENQQIFYKNKDGEWYNKSNPLKMAKRIATGYTFSGDKEDESEDIEAFAEGVSDEIIDRL